MARDFRDLSDSLLSIGSQIVDNANKKKRVGATIIASELTLETPVDEGRARSNWQASVGTPVSRQIEAYAPGDRGSTKGQNTAAAMLQQKSEISKSKPEQPIYIVNNLPYIKPLNEGASAQVTPGWIERAVGRGVEAGQKVKFLRRR